MNIFAIIVRFFKNKINNLVVYVEKYYIANETVLNHFQNMKYYQGFFGKDNYNIENYY